MRKSEFHKLLKKIILPKSPLPFIRVRGKPNFNRIEYDIKYRYIKTANGITPKDLYKLENIFNYNRDKEMIKKIRKEVVDTERKISETAEKMERERLKEGKTKWLNQHEYAV